MNFGKKSKKLVPKREWCWALNERGPFVGKFSSKEDAIHHGYQRLGNNYEIIVGKILTIKITDWSYVAVDDLLAIFEKNIASEYVFGGEVFSLVNHIPDSIIRRELHVLLRLWANKYIRTCRWIMDASTAERVRTRP